MYFDTHIWGLPFSPDLPATQGNMGGQFNPNFIAAETEAPAEGHCFAALLSWEACSFSQLFPGLVLSSLKLETLQQDRGSDGRASEFPGAFALPCRIFAML